MTETAVGKVTAVLAAIGQGDEGASDELLPLVYEELRRLARARMAREGPQTLQPTALVHEAYLRLVGDDDPQWQSRGHFFAAAAEAMRRILIERARRVARLKHGGDRRFVELDADTPSLSQPRPEDLLAIDQALARLERHDPDMAAVVKLSDGHWRTAVTRTVLGRFLLTLGRVTDTHTTLEASLVGLDGQKGRAAEHLPAARAALAEALSGSGSGGS